MRILYGVCGEGMGHATRSRVFLDELVREHEVCVIASGRARDYLAQHFPTVKRILGFTLAYEDNALRRWETVVQNLRGAVTGWPQQIRAYYQIVEELRPDVAVSDFEAFALLFARRHRIPAITVDNIMMLDRCRHDADIVRQDSLDYELAKQLAKYKAVGAFHYIIPTFFRPPVRKRRTTLVAPVLRPEVLEARPEPGDHLLVYQTAEGGETLVETLKDTGLASRVYGVRRDIEHDVRDGHLLFRPFSETQFLEDLRTARGVIAGGGFTLLSECVYLHKPLLSIPVRGQFEQTLNGRYVQKLGYGMYAPAASAGAIHTFLARLPDYEAALAGYSQDGNREALDALHTQLAAAARKRAGQRHFRTRAATDAPAGGDASADADVPDGSPRSADGTAGDDAPGRTPLDEQPAEDATEAGTTSPGTGGDGLTRPGTDGDDTAAGTGGDGTASGDADPGRRRRRGRR